MLFAAVTPTDSSSQLMTNQITNAHLVKAPSLAESVKRAYATRPNALELSGEMLPVKRYLLPCIAQFDALPFGLKSEYEVRRASGIIIAVLNEAHRNASALENLKKTAGVSTLEVDVMSIMRRANSPAWQAFQEWKGQCERISAKLSIDRYALQIHRSVRSSGQELSGAEYAIETERRKAKKEVSVLVGTLFGVSALGMVARLASKNSTLKFRDTIEKWFAVPRLSLAVFSLGTAIEMVVIRSRPYPMSLGDLVLPAAITFGVLTSMRVGITLGHTGYKIGRFAFSVGRELFPRGRK